MTGRQERWLVVTVGGSPEPVLRAIEGARADRVLFVCTGSDPTTMAPGSEQQVRGAGLVVKARPADPKPTLPSIPVQADLPEDRWEVLIVPHDDFVDAFAKIRARLAGMAEDGAAIVADYTGGTKSMTAALVAAALEEPAAELRLVTGPRPDLMSVSAGPGMVTPVDLTAIRLDRRMREALAAWQDFGYGAAAAALARIECPAHHPGRGELTRHLELSRALDRWDRFDHGGAARGFGTLWEALRRDPDWRGLIQTVRALASDDDAVEPLRILDLWLNAERRAARERWDDAVARAYRFIEWTAQWVLRGRGIDTSSVRNETLDAAGIARGGDGPHAVGLLDGWCLVRAHGPEEWRTVAASSIGRIKNWSSVRNLSILAHGRAPIDRDGWRSTVELVDPEMIGALKASLSPRVAKLVPRQLPKRGLGRPAD